MALPPSPIGGEKNPTKTLSSVIGSWQWVKHSLNVPYTTRESLWIAVHLENLFFKHNRAHKSKRQKVILLTLKAWRISAGFVDRDLMQWGVETTAKIIRAKSNTSWILTDNPLPPHKKAKTCVEKKKYIDQHACHHVYWLISPVTRGENSLRDSWARDLKVSRAEVLNG